MCVCESVSVCVPVCVHTRPRASPLIDGLIKPSSLLHPCVFALVQMFCVLARLCTCVCVFGVRVGIVCAQRCDKIGVKWNSGWRGDWIWEEHGPVGQRGREDAVSEGGGKAVRKMRNTAMREAGPRGQTERGTDGQAARRSWEK